MAVWPYWFCTVPRVGAGLSDEWARGPEKRAHSSSEASMRSLGRLGKRSHRVLLCIPQRPALRQVRPKQDDKTGTYYVLLTPRKGIILRCMCRLSGCGVIDESRIHGKTNLPRKGGDSSITPKLPHTSTFNCSAPENFYVFGSAA